MPTQLPVLAFDPKKHRHHVPHCRNYAEVCMTIELLGAVFEKSVCSTDYTVCTVRADIIIGQKTVICDDEKRRPVTCGINYI